MKWPTLGVVVALLVAPAIARGQSDVPEGGPRERGWFAGDRGFSGKLAAGPAYQRIYGISVVSADMQVGIGALTQAGGWYGNLGGRIGSTDGGLAFRQISLGASWEAPLTEGLDLGLGLDGCYVAFERESTSGRIEAFGVGGYAFGSYDVWRSEAAALFVGLQLGLDVFPDENPALWGGTARLGVRLF